MTRPIYNVYSPANSGVCTGRNKIQVYIHTLYGGIYTYPILLSTYSMGADLKTLSHRDCFMIRHGTIILPVAQRVVSVGGAPDSSETFHAQGGTPPNSCPTDYDGAPLPAVHRVPVEGDGAPVCLGRTARHLRFHDRVRAGVFQRMSEVMSQFYDTPAGCNGSGSRWMVRWSRPRRAEILRAPTLRFGPNPARNGIFWLMAGVSPCPPEADWRRRMGKSFPNIPDLRYCL